MYDVGKFTDTQILKMKTPFALFTGYISIKQTNEDPRSW